MAVVDAELRLRLKQELNARARRRIATGAAAPRRECKGCGIPFSAGFTDGCRTCWERARNRRRQGYVGLH
jgi:hypothetical protein